MATAVNPDPWTAPSARMDAAASNLDLFPRSPRVRPQPASRELHGNFRTPREIFGVVAGPAASDDRRAKRRRKKELAEAIRFYVTNRLSPQKMCRECGQTASFMSLSVDIVRPADGDLPYFRGVIQCRNRWLCPVCAASAAGEDRERLAGMLTELHRRGGEAYMQTFTIPHEIQHDLRKTRELVTRCFHAVFTGRPWKRMQAKCGVDGWVRNMEVTHGMNGWHPHIHALLFCRRPLRQPIVDDLNAWIAARWAAAVVRRGWARPDDAHGVTTVRSSNARYLAKMGLAQELMSNLTKRGRGGRRSPWELQYDLMCAQRDGRRDDAYRRDVAIFKDYARGMRGAQSLSFSRGIRARYASAATLETFAQAELPLTDSQAQDQEVLRVPLHIWNETVRHDIRLRCTVLREADKGASGRDLRYLIDRVAALTDLVLFWDVRLTGQSRPLARSG